MIFIRILSVLKYPFRKIKPLYSCHLASVQSNDKENQEEDEEIITENYDEFDHKRAEFNFGDTEEINESVYESEELKAHIEAKFKVCIKVSIILTYSSSMTTKNAHSYRAIPDVRINITYGTSALYFAKNFGAKVRRNRPRNTCSSEKKCSRNTRYQRIGSKFTMPERE